MGALGTAPAMTEEISSYVQGMKIRTSCEATGYMFIYFFTYNLTILWLLIEQILKIAPFRISPSGRGKSSAFGTYFVGL